MNAGPNEQKQKGSTPIDINLYFSVESSRTKFVENKIIKKWILKQELSLKKEKLA